MASLTTTKNLETCECPDRLVLVEGMEVLTKKCTHCVEVERVAHVLAQAMFAFGWEDHQKALYDRARACGLLRE